LASGENLLFCLACFSRHIFVFFVVLIAFLIATYYYLRLVILLVYPYIVMQMLFYRFESYIMVFLAFFLSFFFSSIVFYTTDIFMEHFRHGVRLSVFDPDYRPPLPWEKPQGPWDNKPHPPPGSTPPEPAPEAPPEKPASVPAPDKGPQVPNTMTARLPEPYLFGKMCDSLSRIRALDSAFLEHPACKCMCYYTAEKTNCLCAWNYYDEKLQQAEVNGCYCNESFCIFTFALEGDRRDDFKDMILPFDRRGPYSFWKGGGGIKY
jgi:hypothetical protein